MNLLISRRILHVGKAMIESKQFFKQRLLHQTKVFLAFGLYSYSCLLHALFLHKPFLDLSELLAASCSD